MDSRIHKTWAFTQTGMTLISIYQVILDSLASAYEPLIPHL